MQIFEKNYRMHRIIWMFFNGTFPIGAIDHIDRNKTNNKIENLREVTVSENQQNQFLPKVNNRSGFIGVRPGYKGKFLAEITLDGKKIHLGCFDSAIEASKEYMKAKKEFHPSAFVGKEGGLQQAETQRGKLECKIGRAHV